MSAPSFSSFAPSFASFPDLDPGPSIPAESPTSPRRIKVKKHERKKDRRIKDRKRRRDEHQDACDFEKLGSGGDRVFDDERLKNKEDNDLRDSRRAGSPPLFYSDRKGDPLNVRYGGLHAGDVPKHHLVGRESFHCVFNNI
jgi:hypothetical protein